MHIGRGPRHVSEDDYVLRALMSQVCLEIHMEAINWKKTGSPHLRFWLPLFIMNQPSQTNSLPRADGPSIGAVMGFASHMAIWLELNDASHFSTPFLKLAR